MELYLGNDFTQVFADRVTGGGSFSYNSDNSVVTVYSPSGTNNGAYKDFHFLANTGDEVEFGVYAYANKGKGVITVDLKNESNGQVKNIITVPVTDNELKLYKYKARIPAITDPWKSVCFSVGVTNSEESESEVVFTSPFIKINDTSLGQPQTIAMGLLKLEGSTNPTNLEIVSTYRHFGIKSATFDPTTKEITVTLERRVIPNFRPIIQVTGTYENNIFPLAGNFQNGENPTFKVVFSNGTTRSSLSSGTFYFFVEVKG